MQQLLWERSTQLEKQRILYQQDLESSLRCADNEKEKLKSVMSLEINALKTELQFCERNIANVRQLHENELLQAQTDLDKAKEIFQHETELWSQEKEAMLSSVTKVQEKANLDVSCLREELQAVHSIVLQKQSEMHLQAMDQLRAELLESYQRDITTANRKLQDETLLTFHRLETTQSELDAVHLKAILCSDSLNQKLNAQLEKNCVLCEQLERSEAQKVIGLDME